MKLPSCRDVWLQPYVPLGHKLCVVLFVAGYTLNLFWFSKIAKGVVKALSKKDTGGVKNALSKDDSKVHTS